VKKIRLLLWALVAVAAVALFAVHQINASESTTKGDTLGRVPAFKLVDQRGQQVTDKDLWGSVWIANFVFTRCPSVCPLLTAKFHSLQQQLKSVNGVRFVSISVDPEYDTPAVLDAYASRFQADPARWQFLTGPLKDIERTIVQGFKVHRGDRNHARRTLRAGGHRG
jgi:protein SCO1/2